MRRGYCLTLLTVVAAVSPVPGAEPAPKHPIYVGVKTCATCHDGRGMGHACSLWALSKHARAYAVLARPEAKAIAELSGIPQEPQASPMCLGCHSTGAHAEEWEKDETFFTEDGVQCEKCHGPGSEYMTGLARGGAQSTQAGCTHGPQRDCPLDTEELDLRPAAETSNA